MSAYPSGPLDGYTGDLLDLIATEPTPPVDREWADFTTALTAAADTHGRVSQNDVRPLIRGRVAPRRIGPFYRRACLAGLLAWRGEWAVSDDTEGRNGGKPCRVYEVAS